MPALEFRDVSFARPGGNRVVDHFTLTVESGEVLALVGRSGGGQRQRVGVARALAVDPPVLLMDEPFGALDPVTRAELQAEFRRIQNHLRKTVIIVTHDMGEAFALGDRLGVIDDGALVACDRGGAIVESRDPRVRRLLDATTVIPKI